MILLSKRNAFLFLCVLLLLTACDASKKLQKPTDATILSFLPVDTLLQNLANNKVEVEWLNAKARITFKDDSQTRKFTATIRLKKDSILWMNVKKLSVEAARILVDKDSVYILDRLNKEYYIKSLDYLAEEYHLPADFDALQTMLLGNPYFIPDQELEAKNHSTQYQLIGQEKNGRIGGYWMNGTTFLLEQMSFLDLRQDRKLEVAMEDYQLLFEDYSFSNKRTFKMLSEDTGEVKVVVSFVSVEPDVPKKMPFSISSRYKRVD